MSENLEQQVPSEIPNAASDHEQPHGSVLVADAATNAGDAEAGVTAAATAAVQPPAEDAAELGTGSADLLHAWGARI